WEDFNNELINNWKDIAVYLLSIPMAHQLIGYYTIADQSDGILKVLRSYQYYAVAAISDRVAKNKWADRNQLGGFIWHTTGSGKTMTSFKAAQLIANSKDADKVIFLLDRIELGTQSIKEYRGFAEERESVQETKNTTMLRTRLKSKSPENTLIVTSIQKMSNIKEEDGMTDAELEEMRKNRIVFIIDEAHRSTFGEMMITIKETFPQALFFGFTGTPIKKENERKKNTTTSIFGQELHHYTIADGIRDKNVLGFDPYKVLIYKDREIREKVALNQAKASSVEEAVSKQEKSKVYYHFMDGSKVKMAGFMNRKGKYIKGIEDYIPKNQYLTPDYQKAVVKDICDNWLTLSRNGKFHAIFATSSIQEAISYYRLLKAIKPELRVTALFDPNVDNNDGFDFKEDALVEILTDYEKQYGQLYTLASHDRFKKDVSNRLAHKHQHKWIEREPEKQLDLLIVVNQMLTGFDSKWVNTLYVDQLMKDELIIQAFSRTNRIFGEDKPFGTIRYYRKPHTMERNIEDAVQLYSGDSPVELFVNKLDQNLVMLNTRFYQIRDIFESSGVENFEKLPAERSEKAKFAKLFNSFNDYLEAARIQGFKWSKLHYEISKGAGKKKSVVDVVCDETTYNILVIRYKELMSNGGGGKGPGDVPFDLSTSIIEIDTGMIDADYMNSRFQKYIKALGTEESESLLNELHKTFATLTQEEQKIANLILHDIQNGEIEVDSTLTLRDYINDYQVQIHYDRIKRLSDTFGLDEELLRQMMSMKLTEITLNEFGRFDLLKNSVDKQKAKSYFENIAGNTLTTFKVNVKTSDLLKRFILEGGFEV
ncbi:type I restriction endonuclease subunit R, EcoR124 family, partial [Streptococcus sp. GMD6S]|uniref:type I restriction endonuclease subunit R, EcoR124 family n=3 Tax=Streptococcus TaxID=1301 RepID=UPI000280D77C